MNQYTEMSEKHQRLVDELRHMKLGIEARHRTIDEFGRPCWKPGWEKTCYGRRYLMIIERIRAINTAQGALNR